MFKKERLAEHLHSFIATELRTLHSGAFSLVTITEVRPAKDYKSAKVFWSIPPDKDSKDLFPTKKASQEMQEALEKKIPYLKKRIAAELNLRFVPALSFVFDDSPQRGSRIDELLKKAGY